MGEIALIYRNADSVWDSCYLSGSVDDTAVIFAVQAGSQNKQAIGQIEHGFVIHMRAPRVGKLNVFLKSICIFYYIMNLDGSKWTVCRLCSVPSGGLDKTSPAVYTELADKI